ncbi:MAG: hypothetical protein SOX56_00215 [[Pasteurella] mairii]|uniref:Lipoprotein n=1 Tax=[Pasteurella] mairii TaxID=757 RepID=A0A379B3E8_9PAST|nr:hypothetical protein [[Pasteurella] mairii]SUB33144.1 Uncharacterised protein [[Pasteurella] mairii]
MKKLKLMGILVMLLSAGCELLPNRFHKCSSLTGWCVKETRNHGPIEEIQRWGVSNEPKTKCCGSDWAREVRIRNTQIKKIFFNCRVDPLTGNTLTHEPLFIAHQCLRKSGLCKVNVDKGCK